MLERKLLDIAAAVGSVPEIESAQRLSLELLREVVWFDRGLFLLYEPHTGLPAGPPVSLDMPDRVVGRYIDYLANDEVRRAYRSSNKLTIRSTELFSYSWWTKKSQYFNDFLKPFDLHFLLGCDIKVADKVMGALCLTRGINTGNFTLGDAEVLKLLYPHFQNRLYWHQVIHTEAAGPFAQNRLPVVRDKNNTITRREREIVNLVITGASNAEIAGMLGISHNTVKMHLQNIFDKYQIKRRSQLFLINNQNHPLSDRA